MHWNVTFWCIWYDFLQALYRVSEQGVSRNDIPTIFSNTHRFSTLSDLRHCHIWWLLLSRQFQFRLNSSKQCSLMSFSLQLNEDCSPTGRTRCVHTGGTSCDLPSLFHTFELPSAIRFCFALHVIIVIWLTSSSDEVGCAHERC